MRFGTILSVSLLASAAVVIAQPPAGPVPGAPPASDPQLEQHLLGWETTMKGVSNFSASFNLTRTEAVFKKERKYKGSVLCMKPNYTILRIESTVDKGDYEAYLCDGKSIFEYNGQAKTVTEFKLGPQGAGDNLMLDFLNGMTAKAAKERFQISLFQPAKPDPKQLYVYLDIKPVLGKDKQEFEHTRFALFGPGAPEGLKYLPAQVYLRKPNGDQELWAFGDQRTNSPGINAQVFVPKPAPTGWQVKQAPLGPPPGPGNPMLPGGTNLPPGPGAVRP